MPTQPRTHGQSRGSMLHAPSQDSASASQLSLGTGKRGWWSHLTNVGPVRHRAMNNSELRLTTDREGRQVGQHRSHIVAAVSSAH